MQQLGRGGQWDGAEALNWVQGGRGQGPGQILVCCLGDSEVGQPLVMNA